MESIFHKLEYFLLHEMRMSHIYQPIMIKEILLHRGRATIDQIANALLSKDKSQVEYYRI